MKADFCKIFTIFPLLEKFGLCEIHENLLEIVILKFSTVIVLEYYWLVKRMHLTEFQDQITVVFYVIQEMSSI